LKNRENADKNLISKIDSLMIPNLNKNYWRARYISFDKITGHESDYISISWKTGTSSIRIRKNSISICVDTTSGCITYCKFTLTPDEKEVFTSTYIITDIGVYNQMYEKYIKIDKSLLFTQGDLKNWLFDLCLIYSPLALQFDEIKDIYYKTLNKLSDLTL